MSDKDLLKENEIASLLATYDIGKVEAVKEFTGGTVQTNILVQTTREKFVLRCYKQNRSFESVLFEVHLLNYLKSKNYPCPAVIGNENGEFVGRYDEKPFVLFEFLDGVHVENRNEQQQQQLIQAVAELHILTSTYQPVYAKHRWNYGVEFCDMLATRKATSIGTANARAKLTWYKNELLRLKLPAFLPKGICHCDFHYSNILFKDGKFQALLDFDDANHTFLILDLACLVQPFIASFRWNTWQNFNSDDDVFDLTEVRKTVATYQQYRTLSSLEKECFFDMCKLTVLLDCLWYFERGETQDFFERRKLNYFDRLGREKLYAHVFN